MSRESLLDEAIVKAKEAEDWQLVEWLRMARGSESAARWYTAKLKELKAENAKLREMVRDMMRAWWACDDEICPRHDERCDNGRYCAFNESAKEMGIEVTR